MHRIFISRVINIRAFHISRQLAGEIKVIQGPAFAESISEGDIRWLKQKGDFVQADDLVAEIETDKTSVEVPAPFPGTIVELLVEDGDKVTAKQDIYKLEEGDGPQEGSGVKEQLEKDTTKDQPSDKPKAGRDSDASGHKTPPKQPTIEDSGRVESSDIPKKMPAVKPPSKEPISSKPTSDIKVKAPPSSAADSINISGDRSETRVKMNRMRLRIAERLKEAQNVNAMLTTFNEIDLSNLMQLRKKYQDMFVKKHGVKLGLMSPFIRASALALQEQPIVNAVIEGNEIVYRNFCDISIAVATPKGLVVPVVRNVETMGYATIEKILAELGAKARDGKIAIEDMEGGTFTISNGGVFGSVFGTPIINPPQSAILGMHGIFDRPVAIDGKVEVRPIMYVALTYDHRLIDGREAVTFLRKVKQSVEDPLTILLDL